MESRRAEHWSRREFLERLTLAGTAGLLGLKPEWAAAEPPPETTKLRSVWTPPFPCASPNYFAQELLKDEGFTEVEYIKVEGGRTAVEKALASGAADFNQLFVGSFIRQIDAGESILILAGIHIGCYELFVTDRIRAVRDLKGKSVAVTEVGSGRHLFFASLAKYVGLDPNKDVTWVTSPARESVRLFAEGKIDAFMAFPPEPQELRAKRIGHVLVNTMMDRPWSQHFCCTIAANREFVRKHPVATKRALRAILRATSLCALEPERVARFMTEKGYVSSYDYTLQTLKELPYGAWRELDPEATVRFYALRLYEAGLIKASPQKIIAQGTDWRFLNELKKELKG